MPSKEGLTYNKYLTSGSNKTTKQNIIETLDEIEAMRGDQAAIKQKCWEFVRNYTSAIREMCRR